MGSGPPGERIKPLFPSYLFVRLSLENLGDFKTVRYTRGVNKILGGDNGPVAIDERVLQVIQNRVGERGVIEQQEFLKPGDKVVMKKGVLKDLIGILEKSVDEKGRIEVLFKIVHHQMRAKVYCGDLEKY